MIDNQTGELPFPSQRIFHSLQIALGVVQIRLLYFDVIQVHGRVECNVAIFGCFANNLPMHLASGWDVDDEIALNSRLATQSAAILKRLLAPLAVFLFCLAKR